VRNHTLTLLRLGFISVCVNGIGLTIFLVNLAIAVFGKDDPAFEGDKIIYRR
jgi:hypothetical protein